MEYNKNLFSRERLIIFDFMILKEIHLYMIFISWYKYKFCEAKIPQKNPPMNVLYVHKCIVGFFVCFELKRHICRL